MSNRVKLLLAAGLCFIGCGLGWASTTGSQGYVTSGFSTTNCIATYDGGGLDCTYGYLPGYYVAGTPDGAARGFEADTRVVLVPAVALLLWASRRRRAASAATVRVVTVGLIYFSVRAATEGQASGAAVGTVAALLLISALRHSPRASGVLRGGPAPAPEVATVGTAF